MYQFRSLMGKLLASFLLICAIGLVSSGITFVLVQKMNNNIHEMETINLPMLLNTADITAKASEQVAQLRGYLLTGDPKALENYRNLYQQNKELITALENKSQSEQIKKLAKEVQALNERYSEIAEKGVVPLKQAGKDAEAVEYARRPDVVSSVAAFFSKLSELRDIQKNDISKAMKTNIANGDKTIYMVMVTSLISLIAGCLIGVFVARGITKPVKEMQEMMRRVAQGDLTVRGHVNSKDEIGQMMDVFNDMAKEQNRITIALFGTCAFAVVSVPSTLLNDFFHILLGPFGFLITGMFSGVVLYMLTGALITLMPVQGVPSLMAAIRYLLGLLAFGHMSPVMFLVYGVNAFLLELALALTGITSRRIAPAERSPFSLRKMLVLALACAVADTAATYVGLQGTAVLYRMYYADWYIYLVMAVNGFFYTAVGAGCGVFLGRRLADVGSD